jgi:hypothetical protein
MTQIKQKKLKSMDSKHHNNLLTIKHCQHLILDKNKVKSLRLILISHGFQNHVLTSKIVRFYVSRYGKRVKSNVNSFSDKLEIKMFVDRVNTVKLVGFM